jgi:hypothetical protein
MRTRTYVITKFTISHEATRKSLLNIVTISVVNKKQIEKNKLRQKEKIRDKETMANLDQ